MNACQRTLCAIRGERPDRVPVIPLIIQHALHIAGIPHSEYSTNPGQLAAAQLFARARYGYDGLHITTDNQVISEAMGCKIHFPHDEPPQYLARVLGQSKDLFRLQKSDPAASGRMPVLTGATALARRALGDECFIKANCDSGPFSVAAALRGEEQFFLDLYDDPAFAHALLRVCTNTVIQYALALVDAGAHAITFGDSTAGLVGREFYAEFALPYARQAIAEIKAAGVPVFMHICGNSHAIIDLMGQSGADVLEIDSQMDLAGAMGQTACCLEGNVDTLLLLSGGRGEVAAAAKGCLADTGGRRLILSSGCEVPRHTPPENITALMDASLAYAGQPARKTM